MKSGSSEKNFNDKEKALTLEEEGKFFLLKMVLLNLKVPPEIPTGKVWKDFVGPQLPGNHRYREKGGNMEWGEGTVSRISSILYRKEERNRTTREKERFISQDGGTSFRNQGRLFFSRAKEIRRERR